MADRALLVVAATAIAAGLLLLSYGVALRVGG